MGFWDSVVDAVTSPIKAVETMINTTTNAGEAIGNLAQSAWNDYTGKTAAEMAAKQADKNTAAQLAWNREMATTAHQKEVADLEAAGLNKILTTNGRGAEALPLTPQQSDWSTYGRKSIIDLLPFALNTAQQISNIKLTNNQIISEAANSKLINQRTAESLAKTNLTNTSNRLLDKYGDLKYVLGLAGAAGAGLFAVTPMGKLWKGIGKGIHTAKTAYNTAKAAKKAKIYKENYNKTRPLFKDDEWKTWNKIFDHPNYNPYHHSKSWHKDNGKL